MQPGCKIIANGTDEANAVITLDFGQGSCTTGKRAALNVGSIFIGKRKIVTFGTPYKDIVFAMSNCNDEVSPSVKCPRKKTVFIS